MTLWLVRLVECCDGSEPDEEYRLGVVIEDNRQGGFDLIVEANRRWNSSMNEGEVYEITPLRATRTFKVNRDGKSVKAYDR